MLSQAKLLTHTCIKSLYDCCTVQGKLTLLNSQNLQFFLFNKKGEMEETMNTTILVVDDEQRMRTLIKDFLTKKDYEVIEAKDGEEALEIFNEKHEIINLILLDVMMPKLDGWSVLRQIRQTSKVPIMMLTARGEEQDELFGFELGVDEYVSKPFSPKILVARVEAILKRTSQTQNKVSEYGGIEIDEDRKNSKSRWKDC